MKGLWEESRTVWTVLPLPEIGERSVFDPPQSRKRGKTPSGGRWLLFYILTMLRDLFLGVNMRLAGEVKVLHSQLPWTKESTPQLIN
ncbi:hypothetical protein INR49_024097 [Caranx melampygus]|nr:hypothetical protein INR49_024097 [Caranx melampygus]